MIYLDMDGVIVDFVKGIKRIYGEPKHPEDCWDMHNWWDIDEDLFWRFMGDPNFWLTLEGIPTWLDFYEELKKIAPVTILTAPSTYPESATGKVVWLQKHLGRRFKDYILTKQKHLLARNWTDILIDDKNENVDDFIKAGGSGILVPKSYNNNRHIKMHPYSYVIQELYKKVELLKEKGLWEHPFETL